MKNQILGTTALVVAAASPFAAAAQATDQVQARIPADVSQVDEIIVTGSYRRSLEEAVDIKRRTIGFSDSIVATDVANFPEQNLAEALQRIPGVTIERNKGLGQRVSVRGLPSEFTFVTINGLATASGSGGRDVEFDIFASEIIQQVTVQKSPRAADEEGGIAGSVNISTARPFDYDGRRVVAAVEGAYNSISEKTDPKLSFLASDTWGDWGALLSFSTARRTNRTDSESGINFRPMSRFLATSTGARGTQAAAVLARDAGVIVRNRADTNETDRIIFQDKVGDRAYLNTQDQWGGALSLQYRPSSSFSLAFDALIGRYETTEDQYDAAAYSASSRSTLETIHEYDDTTLADHGMVVLRDVSYTLTQHEMLSKEQINETDYRQFGAELNWSGDSWKLHALAGYSGAEKTLDYANLKHVAYAPSRTRWTADGGETVKSANPASIDMYDSPQSYLFEAYETTLEQITDDKYAAQIDFTKYLGLDFFPALTSVQFGARYTDKSKERQYGALNIQGTGPGRVDYLNRPMSQSELTPIGDLVPGGAFSVRDLNWSQVSNDYARRTFRYDGFFTPFAPGDYYEVSEEVLSLYAMADLNFDIGPVPVSVNGGARYVDTSITSSGYHQIQNPNGTTGYTPDPVSSDGSYDKVLPSLNVTAELTDRLILRAAASETLIRPALTDLAYKRTASFNSFRFTDGNPNLKPTYAKQWEVGLEQYLGDGGLLAVSYFWKEIEGVVRQALTGTVPNVTKYNANGTIDGVYTFDVYQPINEPGSYDVSGVELVAVVPFGQFYAPLEGFGINANYTVLDSSLTGTSKLGIPTPPIGLADNTYNVTLFYENTRFQARASYNFKDKYVEAIGYEMYPIWREGYGQVDLSASYRVTDAIQINLEGINVTDEATKGYTMDPSFPTMYELSGRRINLGLRMEF
ncbi:MAG: TonB-dependent receptor [Brevundimonas sp.]|uniref:TonB-dependent receptor n=1 Tax=Brevundimonas sp. TaxID=1871086 RepID=UPI000DB58B4C|nr:TonB-dependent receptor [Brevundimonas sp.]PZU00999.1 MAG: TonB-dependent receptor [Brevundimonas sp.]